ncbi:MAG: phosphatidate cytidylyltransferase [Planctomycetota bacterium]
MADSIKVRIAIGSVLIVAISGLIYLDHATGHGYGAIGIGTLVIAAALLEFGRMAATVAPVPTRTLALCGALYALLKGLGYELDPRLHHLTAPLVVAFLYAVFFLALRGEPREERLRGLALSVFGFVYLPWLAGFALDARFIAAAAPGYPPVGEAAFFYVIAIAKGTDICAYFAGKLTGKTKFVPSVSPGKTVAGFVGALAGGVLITAAFVQFSALGQVLPWPLVPGVGLVLALVVVSGDLIESFIKRSVAVKDSAALLPSFGGVLDIIDSIVIAAPPVYFLLRALPLLTGGKP